MAATIGDKDPSDGLGCDLMLMERSGYAREPVWWLLMDHDEDTSSPVPCSAGCLTGSGSEERMVVTGAEYRHRCAPTFPVRWNEGLDAYSTVRLFGPWNVHPLRARLGDRSFTVPLACVRNR